MASLKLSDFPETCDSRLIQNGNHTFFFFSRLFFKKSIHLLTFGLQLHLSYRKHSKTSGVFTL